MRKQRHDPTIVYNCPVEAALDVVGGKWKGVILFQLAEKTRRFNELNRIVCKVSPRILTKQLRELEDDALIRRKVYAEVPPRVEYSLTPKGEAILPAMNLLKEWGMQFVLEGKPTEFMKKGAGENSDPS